MSVDAGVVLALVAVAGFGYFVYKKVTAKKPRSPSGGGGGGKTRPPTQRH